MAKSGGTGWLNALAPAIGVIAGTMIVTGVYLLDPAAIALGFALDAKRTWLVGAYLIAAGAALAFKLRWPKDVDSGSVIVDLFLNFTLGEMSHFAYGGIAVAIGGQALFATPPNYWAALLLVPGLLSLTIALSDNDKGAKDKAEKPKDEDEDDGDATAPESGQIDLRATALVSLILGAIYAVYMFGFFVWLALAFALYYALKGIILDSQTIDVAAAGAVMWKAVVNMLPTAAPMAIVIAAIVGGIAMIGTIFQWVSQRRARDSNRDLSPSEIAYIDASTEAVTAYAKAQGYDRNVWVVQAFGLVAVLGAIAVGGAVAVYYGGTAFDTPPAGPSFPIELRSRGLSMVGWIFVAIFLSALPHTILSRLSRRYSERSAWVAVAVKNNYFTLRGKLTTFVRARRLSTATPINPGEFLHAANLSFEPFFYVPAIVLAAMTLFFMHRDLNAVDVLTADAIEVTDYWTLAKERYSYGDVERVVLRCHLTDKGEPVEAYVLHLKGGRTLDIYREQAVVEKHLDAYLTVDAKLIALGAPFVPGAHPGWFRDGERGYDPDCVDKAAEAFPEKDRPGVRTLFHLEEMHALEDIWPWDDALAQAWRAGDKYEGEKAAVLFTKVIESRRLSGHLLAVAYFGRANARRDYELAYGIRDAAMILALRDYQKSREIESTMRSFRREGVTYIALGAYDEARAALGKALKLDTPKPYWPLIDLARLERVQGNYDAALKHLDEISRIWGEDNAGMPAYYHRALVLYLKNDNAGAAAAITKGIADQPDYPSAYAQRACAYARLGDFAKAKEDIAQAIKLAHAPPFNEAWEKTPQARAYYAEQERDRTLIDAMQAGTASDADRATLCANLWDYGETLRTRSPLLPPGG
ncbi:MAG: tetratricopeptide repeat protein [Alphaproteobacteria bacterium]|nr:tetratricopeptide repeat protein [Alphaproteobacteria bacterium]